MMIPMTKTGHELPQLLTDMRQSKTLPWKEVVVIGDEILSI